MLWIGEFLEVLKQEFVQQHLAKLQNKDQVINESFEFKQEFANIWKTVETRHRENKAAGLLNLPKNSYEKKKQKQSQQTQQQEEEKSDEDNVAEEEQPAAATTKVKTPDSPVSLSKKGSALNLSKEEIARRLNAKNSAKKPATPATSPTTSSKKTKQKTEWENQKYSESAAKGLNMNKGEENNDEVQAATQKYMTTKKVNLDDDDDVDTDKYKVKESSNKSGFFSFFSSLVQGKELTSDVLEPVLKKLSDLLVQKNVSAEIAGKISESVGASLAGQKVGTFASVTNLVNEAMEEALTRILTPKKRIDVLRDIMHAREQGRPYTIVMVGVNGVGKSTSLSKLAFWLKQNNFSVMIAACDTFRSGAIEQLKVHATCLQVPLYQKGYESDAAVIAFEAVDNAKKNQIDVVLVDTAGRMQHNEPLMRSLTKVIQLNNPDLVLFVGEALVGTDGVDQLVSFDEALVKLSTDQKQLMRPNTIDGIFLTKFDTIDDKVGAAISMVYTTGHPILFVGVGQTYADLKNLSTKAVVRALLK